MHSGQRQNNPNTVLYSCLDAVQDSILRMNSPWCKLCNCPLPTKNLFSKLKLHLIFSNEQHNRRCVIQYSIGDDAWASWKRCMIQLEAMHDPIGGHAWSNWRRCVVEVKNRILLRRRRSGESWSTKF